MALEYDMYSVRCQGGTARYFGVDIGGGPNGEDIFTEISYSDYLAAGNSPRSCVAGQVTGMMRPSGSGSPIGGGAINRFLSGRGKGISKFKNFMTSEDASMKSNLIFTGSAVLGALAARKFIKKGDKNLNTVLGGVGGLLIGVAITKIVK